MLPLLLVVLAAPKGAPPPSKPSLPSKAAVFVSSPDEAAAARAELELTKALEAESVKVVDVTADLPVAPRDGTGDTLMKEARQAFDDLDYQGSADKWAAALEFFIKHPEIADAKALGDAHFFIGALAILNGGKGQAKRAQEEFARALLHHPELTCDAQVYGADVKKAFDKAQADVAKKDQGRLSIDSTPPGAEVSLRGKVLGRTPIADVPALPVGRHLVLFSKVGHEPGGAFADVTKEGATVKPELLPVKGYLEIRDAATSAIGKGVGVSGPLPDHARKLAQVVKARFLVMSDGTTAEVWDTETGNRVAGLPLDDLPGTAQKIEKFISKPSAPVAVAEKRDGPVATGAITEKWWFWTAVGVVAVGAGTAVGVAAANNSGGRPFNVVLGTP
ncbi:MAG: PEGA domain-containing protein [Myxococcota bacterium]